MTENRSRQRGATLVELVISIVVIGVAVAGVVTVFSQNVGHSADPMLQEQAVAIAEAYMEEITLKPFSDPDTGNVCTDFEANRADFDDVCDYNGLTDTGAHDQGGGPPVTGLEQYNVTVAVAGDALNGITAANALRVDVRVTHASIPLVDVRLSGYRTNY